VRSAWFGPMTALAVVVLAGCRQESSSAAAGSAAKPAELAAAHSFEQIWAGRELSELELQLIIEELDTAAREGGGLGEDAAERLLGKLASGKPATMGAAGWHHFFNSSLNALGASRTVSADALGGLLLPLVEEHHDKVLRLYALQHLGIHQPRTSEPLRSQIGQRVFELAQAADEEVTGTAMALVEQWHGELGATVEKVTPEHRGRLAAATLADRNRPVEVRVGAAHMAADGGYPEALAAAREIAGNAEEPTTLRKACLYLIGQLGDANDRDLLNRCAMESIRLAQAANPAFEALLERIAGRAGPTLTPYQ
jgi:hypothetical protein